MADSPLRIGMLLFPKLTQLDLTGPWEVFSRMPNTQVYLVAATLDPVKSENGSGLTLIPDVSFADAPQFDVLFVPGGSGINQIMTDETTIAFLQQQANHAKYITAVCTGSLILAAAGLLKGKRATTHWLSLEILDILGVETVKQRVVIDGNCITGGGVTSGIDFALVVAAEIFGESVARRIQLMIEYNPQPPFNSGSPDSADPETVQAIIANRTTVQQEREALARQIARRFAG
jgi:cyclohexyl-isocyanide hydratase